MELYQKILLFYFAASVFGVVIMEFAKAAVEATAKDLSLLVRQNWWWCIFSPILVIYLLASK